MVNSKMTYRSKTFMTFFYCFNIPMLLVNFQTILLDVLGHTVCLQSHCKGRQTEAIFAVLLRDYNSYF